MTCTFNPSCRGCPPGECEIAERYRADAERDREIFRLHTEAVPTPELVRAFKVSFRHVHRVIERGGPSESGLKAEAMEEIAAPEDLPVHDFKGHDYSAPGVRRARGGTRLYPKACPKCGGDVRWHDGTLTCMQCGFERERLVSA